jgi:hypothetical protein
VPRFGAVPGAAVTRPGDWCSAWRTGFGAAATAVCAPADGYPADVLKRQRASLFVWLIR